MKTKSFLNEHWQISKLAPNSSIPDRVLKVLPSNMQMGEDWYDTKRMPAQVHEILIDNGVIENYAIEGRCDKYEWVAEHDWIYRCVFQCDNPANSSYLCFKGLDTLVDIYLNGEFIAEHKTMYRPLNVNTSGKLLRSNVLLLHFKSPWAFLRSYQQPEGYTHSIDARWALRKTNDDFSRYLGAQPKCSTAIGVFDDIVLFSVDRAEISYLDIDSRLNTDFNKGTLNVTATINCTEIGNYVVKFLVEDEAGLVIDDEINLACCTKGETNVNSKFTIRDPKLWWPKDYGKQPLYKVEARLYRDLIICDSEIKKIGFRDVRMDGLFDFKVNGKAIKLWGGCFAPVDRDGISHYFDRNKFMKIMDLVENGMNSLRIWGPGVPYGDELYDEADKRGILLWQEFYGDSNMYPETEEFISGCCADAEYMLKRLKHRPSILLWCGGNESLMWAHIEDPNQTVYGKRIYLDDYKELCLRIDPQRFYYPSCPMGGKYPNDPIEGDTHGLEHRWWFVPGVDYPYFFSENTRVSPPSLKSLLRFMKPKEIWPDDFSGIVKHGDNYQIPPAWMYRSAEEGNAMWDKFGPVENYYTPTCAEELVYNVAAARGFHFKQAVERCRRGRPHYEKDRKRRCFGHFVWKLNDTLPQIYSSVVDFYAEPYIPYYAMIRAYSPVLISFEVDDQVYVWVVNDSGEKIEGKIVIKVFNPLDNSFVKSLEMPINVDHDEASLIADLYELGMLWRQHLLCAWIYDKEGNCLAEKIDYLTLERYFTFPDANLSLRIEGNEIIVSTDKFAHCVELEGDNNGDKFNWLFEDNYFDLLPGSEKRVKIKGIHQSGTITAKAHYANQATTISSMKGFDQL